MIRRLCLAAALVLVAVPALAQPLRVRVFVTSVGAQSGFTDPSKDNRDTVKDLKDDIQGKRRLMLTDRREEALIVLEVVGRETAGITASLFGAARDRLIRVRFMAAGTETDLTASAQGGTMGSGGAWGKAAGKIVDQVDQWVVANRARLLP
jgi:hypothetical protein